VHALPFVLALATAVAMAPLTLRALLAGGHVRPNYRKRPLVFPFGVLSVAAALVALIPLSLVREFDESVAFFPVGPRITFYVVGVALLGLIDDTLGGGQRGWRGHGGAVLRGELSTGALKAAGSLGLALYALSHTGEDVGRYLLAVAVLVLATNLFNLLDLRPGRTGKAFVLLGAGLSAGTASLKPLWSLGLFIAPALVAGVYDLRERALLGDTGANLVGALAGLWIVLSLSTLGQGIALGVILALTVYGELRSISALVERTPGLRGLDSLGRPR
jgi:UDP-N-acetylmuramyl pentapeptide phosphotransferase/UDP-N-acetylglucosamine-1-phosphate transferase